MAPPSLLSLPLELRLQIWNLVLGPMVVQVCCSRNAAGFREGPDPDRCCDNRLLRVNRQIYQEVGPLFLNSPKRFEACSGACLETLILRTPVPDRRWIRRVTVNLYVGKTPPESINGRGNLELLQTAEAWCGPYVQSALKCQGVCTLSTVVPVGQIQSDNIGRRVLKVDITINPPSEEKSPGRDRRAPEICERAFAIEDEMEMRPISSSDTEPI